MGYNEGYRQIVERDHPAKFPVLLVRDQIPSWSNKGDVILDPFSGSGTTAIVAILTGRNYIGFENNKIYANNSQEYIRVVKRKIDTNDSLVLKFLREIDEICLWHNQNTELCSIKVHS